MIFLKFIKRNATLMNNEFGDYLNSSGANEGDNGKESGRFNERYALASGIGKNSKDLSNYSKENFRNNQKYLKKGCIMCLGPHGIWKCNKFQSLSHQERKKVVTEKALCVKCLGAGHYVRTCLKKHFRCQIRGCGKEHRTLVYPQEANRIEKERKDPNQGEEKADSFGPQGKEQHDLSDEVEGRNKVIAAAGAGDSWVCLGVIPVKIQAEDGNSKAETYALLDSGSEVTLCHEQLSDKLGSHAKKSNYTLTGITGSQNVETSVELANIRTVNYKQKKI